MAVKAPKGWYDITVPLKQGIIYFPTDPVPPKIYRLHDRALGAKVTMSMLEIISHTGTHIDAPLHFIADGETITDMPLDATVGPARVIAIKDRESIKAAELKKHNIKKGERILFKTRNSPTGYEGEKFSDDYCYLDDDGADYLVEKGVKLVGIDFITIGTIKRMENIAHTHEALLGAGIYIMEDCALANVPPGEYELLCLPLPVYKGDAAPCRAILRPLK
ncbi:MAG: cyclase family protein [Dehalococcoidales bacterium]|nr:cyclase family protein [Dehalococcoidales bacterium]